MNRDETKEAQRRSDAEAGRWRDAADRAETLVRQRLDDIDRVAEHNQIKVLRAMQRHKVSDFHFVGSTGYGYHDIGRETLDLVYAEVFGAEAAVVRPHFASGTHTIATALFGVLRPGDHLVSLTGPPYDTLRKVIGAPGDGTGSLSDFGIRYEEVPLRSDGSVDWEQAERIVRADTRVIAIQRSRGYSWRPSFTVEQIGSMIAQVRRLAPQAVVFVDNCYGEFVETIEPTEVGADLIAGSLIKNPGGGLAPTGGYIAGKREWVEKAAYRMTAPGIGGEVGAVPEGLRLLYQGLFLAPHIVGQALKGAVFAAGLFGSLGFDVHPGPLDPRTDLIQAIRFDSREQLIAFVQSVQKASPVDAHVVPEPSDMPGYSHPVIMAAGTFVQGSSIELSADAPVREPYIAFMQGGLTYAHVKYAVVSAVEELARQQLLSNYLT
jgi:cystathionine beta-lyase family protein involved in aluminum resistance